MEQTYIPFSEPVYSVQQTDILQYNPQSLSQIEQSNCVQLTHCYVCGKGWGYSYWKHCNCSTVPVGDGTLLLAMFLTVYALFKYFKR